MTRKDQIKVWAHTQIEAGDKWREEISKVSSPRAKGADAQGYRYTVQLALEGISYQKPKNKPGHDVTGLDLGPSTLAIVPREGEARLVPLCEELKLDARRKRR